MCHHRPYQHDTACHMYCNMSRVSTPISSTLAHVLLAINKIERKTSWWESSETPTPQQTAMGFKSPTIQQPEMESLGLGYLLLTRLPENLRPLTVSQAGPSRPHGSLGADPGRIPKTEDTKKPSACSCIVCRLAVASLRMRRTQWFKPCYRSEAQTMPQVTAHVK